MGHSMGSSMFCSMGFAHGFHPMISFNGVIPWV